MAQASAGLRRGSSGYGYAHPPVPSRSRPASQLEAEPVAPSPVAPCPPRVAPVPAPAPAPAPRAAKGAPRGSLLEQLAECQANAASLITDMRATFPSRYAKEGLLLTLTTRYLHVGTCTNRFAGTARFFGDEVVYTFEHPRHRRVHMHMRYADMSAIDVLAPRDPHGPGLRFRIANELQYFAREYDPADADHHLVLRFSSVADMQRFVTLALPTVRAVAAGGARPPPQQAPVRLGQTAPLHARRLPSGRR